VEGATCGRRTCGGDDSKVNEAEGGMALGGVGEAGLGAMLEVEARLRRKRPISL